MPYTINRTNGIKITVVQDGTIDTASLDITLVGKNYSGYGESFNENFVKLLENFSNSTQPKKPLSGQLWFDSKNKKIKIYDGAKFKSIGVIDNSVVRPTNMNQGDLWYNPTDLKLYAFTGNDWVLIGPAASSGSNGVSTTSILDNNPGNSHPVSQTVLSNTTPMIVAAPPDGKFEVQHTNGLYNSFPNILPGINLAGTTGDGISTVNTSTGFVLWGTAASALGLVEGNSIGTSDLVPVSQLVKKTDLTSGQGAFQIVDDGIIVGLQKVVKIHASSTIGKISNIRDARIEFNVTTNGTFTNVINIDGTSGLRLIPASLPALVDIGAPSQSFNAIYVNQIYNGSTGSIFGSWNIDTLSGTNITAATSTITDLFAGGAGDTGTVHGTWMLDNTATFESTYADIAERYAADAEYVPGTVLVIGGTAEVTTTDRRGNTAVAGIVSTAPSYKLNTEAGNDITHPYIALKGRVPCKVVGPISKGDLLVTSSTAGHAERAHANDNPNAVLGRALQDFEDSSSGLIEVMVA
jgi:hypothetical protein